VYAGEGEDVGNVDVRNDEEEELGRQVEEWGG